MDLPVSWEKNPRFRFGLVFSLICFVVFFRSRSLFDLFGRTALGFLTGFAIGEIRRRTESKKARYGLYGAVIFLFLLIIFVPLYLSAQRCLAVHPYEAVNIFTGNVKEFTYGGCGPRPHPWYYVTN